MWVGRLIMFPNSPGQLRNRKRGRGRCVPRFVPLVERGHHPHWATFMVGSQDFGFAFFGLGVASFVFALNY